MIAQFATFISYGQILVFVSGLPRPGLLWSDEHVAQGFAWSPGIVSFGVPDPDKECLVRVSVADHPPAADKSLWALRVPFEVPVGLLKIGTVGDMNDVRVPPGRYDLFFVASPGETIDDAAYSLILDLTFSAAADPQFSILRKGNDLTTDRVLRKDAEHA